MIWSKMKQQLESFLCPALVGRVEYSHTSYRYLQDKAGRCYITVDKKEILNMNKVAIRIKWYQSEQEIKNDPDVQIPISLEDIEVVRKETGGKVPEERLEVIAKNSKMSAYARDILDAQVVLSKSDFYLEANKFLSSSIEESLESKNILLNIFSLVDRRIGKVRLLGMKEKMKSKHPIVQYFYELRRSTM